MILVTGASGFLGRHLVGHLAEQGLKLRALYYRNPPTGPLANNPLVEWRACDLLDVFDVEEAMKDIREVYHCAAIVSFHPSEKERVLHFNVTGTAHIVNEALSTGIRKLVYVSSVGALGRSESKTKPITEDTEWEESRYNSRYALSKYLAELEVWRGMGEGLQAAIVNPGIILGEGNWEEGSARLMKVVNQEFPFYTLGINSFVDVKDVVQAMVNIMESEIHSERFILSAGNYSYKDIFTLMAEYLGKRPPYIRAGTLLTGMVWRWSLFRSKIFNHTITVTRETARTARKQAIYRNDKLLSFFPEFRYRDIRDTIRRMALVFKQETQK
jgi:dihydroflavonol-4-reductase